MIDLNDVDGPLCEIKYMAEIAAELTDSLDSNEANPGFFQISLSEGNRLAFLLQRFIAASRGIDGVLHSRRKMNENTSPPAHPRRVSISWGNPFALDEVDYVLTVKAWARYEDLGHMASLSFVSEIPNRLHAPTRDRRVQQDRLLDDGGLRQIVC